MTQTVPYFAFGANTCRSVLVERRGIRPRSSRGAVLLDHALSFGLAGVPLVEPAFATCVARPGARVYGVLHELEPRDLHRLDRIEGRGYARVPCAVTTNGGDVVAAFVYRARRPVAGRRPSRRYLSLLLAGAREHDLPEAWVAELMRVETARIGMLAPVIAAIVRHGDRLLARLHR